MARAKRKTEESVKETPVVTGKALERQELIDVLKSKLLTNEQLKKGGSGVRVAYEREKGYQAVIDEINSIGKELGLPPVKLGGLRR